MVGTSEKLISSSALPAYIVRWRPFLPPHCPGIQNTPNHLVHEKSPYLKQHACNPVDWYPWGPDAFDRAAAENKPVFLSIGYATCHWCHVMAHESFEDTAIADLLNNGFIAVKVDREERPDIDSVYMTACQQMTGQGGWPLTILMTPGRKPFFAGTYLPPRSRAGMIGLAEILKNVTRLWQEQQDTLVSSAEKFTGQLAEMTARLPEGKADISILRDGYKELVRSFDPVNGGFGRAPKFPTPVMLLFMLRYGKRTGSGQALRIVEETLDALYRGGIHDHLGGGFHRYSTDNAWRVPHFEKMLYDQALLLMAFTEAYLATKKPVYKDAAETIITYVTRDLSSPEGAFVSAEDADSSGGEGAYYLWTRKELDDVLGPVDSPVAAAFFGVEEGGNFLPPAREPEKNVLYLKKVENHHRQSVLPERIRQKLSARRKERPRPKLDDKILTDWNGLMIAALAKAARAFDNDEYLLPAKTAMNFILERLQQADGRLLHRYCDGEAAIPGFADDYAFIIHALIELCQTSLDPAWLEEALRLTRILDRHFSDTCGCGYFTTPEEADPLIVRKKEIYDGAIPSGNSVMLANLVFLGHLTGNAVHEEQASLLADCFGGLVRISPSASCAFLCGLDHLFGPALDIVIVSEESDPGAGEMIRRIRGLYLPSVSILCRTPATAPALDSIAPFTRTMTAREGKATAYVCHGHTCSAPITDPEILRETIGEKSERTIRGS
jgi:uncharacterized protein